MSIEDALKELVEDILHNRSFSQDEENAIREIADEACNNFDFDELVGKAVDEHDFSDELKDIDWETDVEKALHHHDFSDDVSDALKNFDFDEDIKRALHRYDFSDDIHDALEGHNLANEIDKRINANSTSVAADIESIEAAYDNLGTLYNKQAEQIALLQEQIAAQNILNTRYVRQLDSLENQLANMRASYWQRLCNWWTGF